ncbi:MAG: hypothetical protein BWY72_02517 [Bacteroidetes bacterium ADurb.Bin416]|nr:MAG: hypothetical protein BWY72_02517 [Bacteroidetes bacterium ADurb.Bin416]
MVTASGFSVCVASKLTAMANPTNQKKRGITGKAAKYASGQTNVSNNQATPATKALTPVTSSNNLIINLTLCPITYTVKHTQTLSFLTSTKPPSMSMEVSSGAKYVRCPLVNMERNGVWSGRIPKDPSNPGKITEETSLLTNTPFSDRTSSFMRALFIWHRYIDAAICVLPYLA